MSCAPEAVRQPAGLEGAAQAEGKDEGSTGTVWGQRPGCASGPWWAAGPACTRDGASGLEGGLPVPFPLGVGVGVEKQGAEAMGTWAISTDVRDVETAEIKLQQ